MFKMIIAKAYATNFLSIKELTINFLEYSGLVAIEGINEDTEKASSNGAGKSSIIEMLLFGLFGETRRKESPDLLVNNKVKRNCLIEIDFFVNNEAYRIIRTRKHDKYGNHLMLYHLDSKTELTKATVGETQRALEDILNITKTTFSQAICFGQGDIKPFATMTDAEMKKVFEEGLGINYIAQYHQKAKQYKVDLEKKQFEIQYDLENYEKKLKETQEQKEKAIEARESFQKAKRKEIRELQAELKELANERLSRIGERDKHSTKEELMEKEKDLLKKMGHLHEIEQAYEKLNDYERKLHIGKAHIEAQKTYKQEEIDEAQITINDAEHKIGRKCNECGREFSKSDIALLIKTTIANQQKCQKEIENLDSQIAKIDTKLKEVQNNKKKLDDQIDKLNTYKQQLDDINHQKYMYKLGTERIAHIEERIVYIDKQLKKIKDKELNLPVPITTYEKEEKELIRTIADLRSQNETLKKEIELTDLLIELLGNGGVKTHIFETITPELNRLASQYLSILGEFDINITTTSRLKNGEIRDKFSIKVANKHGAHSYKGNSYGERQKIDLAISLAFNEVIRKTNGVYINLLFLDEPFESLDSVGVENVVELCEQFVKRVDSLFLISHTQELRDLAGSKLTVVKKDGFTTLQ